MTETETEAIVKPDGVTDDICGEAMAFVSVHRPILSISGSLLVITRWVYVAFWTAS
jgi:hypothetical protein